MTSPNHPSAPLLAEFATGTMPFAPAVVISAHLETCARCRAAVRAREAAEGRALETAEPIPLAAGSLDRVLAQLDAEVANQDEAELPERHLADVKLPLAVARTGLRSRRWLAPGLWAAPVAAPPTDDWRAFLLRVPVGVSVPRHGHQGSEYVTIIAGQFEDGRVYQTGDFAENLGRREHRLKVRGAEACVCIVAIQGRTQWRGWARILTPILGL